MNSEFVERLNNEMTLWRTINPDGTSCGYIYFTVYDPLVMDGTANG